MDQPNHSMIMDKACDVDVCDVNAMSSSKKKNEDIDQANGLSSRIKAVFDYMNKCLKENGTNYVRGVAKFLKSYQSLEEIKKHYSIASALHIFGMEGLWYCMVCFVNVREGMHHEVLIPVQTTATSSCRKGVPKGWKPIPQGC